MIINKFSFSLSHRGPVVVRSVAFAAADLEIIHKIIILEAMEFSVSFQYCSWISVRCAEKGGEYYEIVLEYARIKWIESKRSVHWEKFKIITIPVDWPIQSSPCPNTKTEFQLCYKSVEFGDERKKRCWVLNQYEFYELLSYPGRPTVCFQCYFGFFIFFTLFTCSAALFHTVIVVF